MTCEYCDSCREEPIIGHDGILVGLDFDGERTYLRAQARVEVGRNVMYADDCRAVNYCPMCGGALEGGVL